MPEPRGTPGQGSALPAEAMSRAASSTMSASTNSTAATTNRVARSLDTSPTVGRRRPRIQYQQRDQVDRHLSVLYGARSPGAAHQRALRAVSDVERLLVACRIAGAQARSLRIIERLQAATEEPVMPPSDSDLRALLAEAQGPDQQEDLVEHRYILGELNPAVEETYLRGIYADMAMLRRVARALEARRAAR